MVVISRCVTEALRYMYVTVIHDLSRSLARSITACYVLSVAVSCGQLRFDQGVTRFFFGLSRSATDRRNVDTIQYKAYFFSFCIRTSPLK